MVKEYEKLMEHYGNLSWALSDAEDAGQIDEVEKLKAELDSLETVLIEEFNS